MFDSQLHCMVMNYRLAGLGWQTQLLLFFELMSVATPVTLLSCLNEIQSLKETTWFNLHQFFHKCESPTSYHHAQISEEVLLTSLISSMELRSNFWNKMLLQWPHRVIVFFLVPNAWVIVSCTSFSLMKFSKFPSNGISSHETRFNCRKWLINSETAG